MTVLESNSVLINTTPEKVYAFLSDLNMHEQIMPDQVSDWSSTEETCQYTIKGTGSVYLKIEEKLPNTSVRLVPNGKIPFPFNVNWKIEEAGNMSRVQVVMEADLNPILKMMASKPLHNFINLQIDGLVKVFNG